MATQITEFKLGEVVGNTVAFRSFLQEQNLLPEIRLCPHCDRPLTHVGKGGFFGVLQCRFKTEHVNKKDFQISETKGTCFENCKIPPEQLICLFFCFSQKYTYEMAIKHCLLYNMKVSSATVSKFYMMSREICLNAIETASGTSQDLPKIGGVGKIVEIDETKIGKRKYQRGRFVDGTWIFGLIERDGGSFG